MTRRLLVTAALLFAASLAILAFRFLDPTPPRNVRINGDPLPDRGALAPFLAQRAAIWGAERITIETGVHVWRATRAELGARLDVTEGARAVHQLGRSLNPLLAARGWWTEHHGPGWDVRWRPRLGSPAAIASFVDHIREEVDRLPTEASTTTDGRVIAGLPGETVDVPATQRAIEAALQSGERQVKVGTVVTRPLATVRRFLDPKHEASVLMMRQETTYRTRNQGRALNIELSAKKLDGQTILPGAELSFNRVVGKRTLAAGFAPAQELLNGEIVIGVGGGVCQTAGTLHAAAFFAGLTVEEYRAHSRLSQLAYLRPGLDTMVAWPDGVDDLPRTKDMRVRNPYPFPIVVRTEIVPGEGGTSTLRVDLYGAARPYRVDYSFEELEQVPGEQIRREDKTLPFGSERVKQEALSGLVILRRRTIYMPDQRVEEAVRVSYPAMPRIVLVGGSETDDRSLTRLGSRSSF